MEWVWERGLGRKEKVKGFGKLARQGGGRLRATWVLPVRLFCFEGV